jgi:ComF family protein
MEATRDFSVCSNCRRKTALRRVWVRTTYDDISSRLILAFKFERARQAYKPLATAMASTSPVFSQDTLLVGVPTSTSRIRERGYDHVGLLVKQCALLTGVMWRTPVVRTGQAHQFGSSRAERRKQLENAFHVISPDEVKGQNILLIDDVLTTGATLETLAKVLNDAGAKRVDALVFAQKV